MSDTRAPYAGRTLPAGAMATERDLQDEIRQLRVQVAELDAFNNDLLADVATGRAALARARAGIAGLRREHTAACARIRYYPADGGRVESCDCGVTAHNAAVDLLLQEGT